MMKGELFDMKIDWMELKKQIAKHVGYNLLVLLCAVLAVVFLVMSIVALFSIEGNEGIMVKEAFDVSSAPLDAANQSFVAQLNGYLINYEDQKTEVENVIVVIGNGRDRQELTLEGITLHPRLAEEIRYEWKTHLNFDRVHSVWVVVNGERQLLANSTAEWNFDPNILLYAALCALACFGTVFTFKKRYYRYEEELIATRSAKTDITE